MITCTENSPQEQHNSPRQDRAFHQAVFICLSSAASATFYEAGPVKGKVP
jgi:hypothetical protein